MADPIIPRELMQFFNNSREIQRYFNDLGIKTGEFANTVPGADEDNIIVFDDDGDLKDSGVNIDTVSIKVIGGTEDNILVIDGDGDMKDGGFSISGIQRRSYFYGRIY